MALMTSEQASSAEPNTPFTLAGMRRGAVACLPFAVSASAAGVVLGVTYRTLGVDGMLGVVLSATVFSGTAQAATAAMWLLSPLPIGAMILAVLSINARYLVMGAHLRQLFPRASRRVMLPTLLLLVDGAWLVTMSEAQKGRRDLGVLVGSGLLLYVGWILGTLIGCVVEIGAQGSLKVLAAFLPLSFIVALLPAQWRGQSSAVSWLVAAAATLAALAVLPVSWAALAGGAVGAVFSALRRRAA